jgi:WD40 repeat protein
MRAQTVRRFAAKAEPEHRGNLASLTLAPNGAVLFSQFSDGNVQVWNTATGQVPTHRSARASSRSRGGVQCTKSFRLKEACELAVSPDGKTLYAAASHKSSSRRSTIAIDVESGAVSSTCTRAPWPGSVF